jgi:hypothetical protein
MRLIKRNSQEHLTTQYLFATRRSERKPREDPVEERRESVIDESSDWEGQIVMVNTSDDDQEALERKWQRSDRKKSAKEKYRGKEMAAGTCVKQSFGTAIGFFLYDGNFPCKLSKPCL